MGKRSLDELKNWIANRMHVAAMTVSWGSGSEGMEPLLVRETP